MTQGAPLQFVAPEEAARANLYGLVARLFYAAPDAQLISELLNAPAIEGEGELDRTIHVEPAADLRSLDFVQVLTQPVADLRASAGTP